MSQYRELQHGRLCASASAVIVCVAMLLALACASSEPTRIRWTKAGSSEQELRRDRDECMAQPEVVETAQIKRADATAAKVGWARFEACMRERGWSATTSPPRPPQGETGAPQEEKSSQ